MVSPFVPPLLRAALVRAARASRHLSRSAPALLQEIGLSSSCAEQIRMWVRDDVSEQDAAIELRLLALQAEQALAHHVSRSRLPDRIE